MKTIHHESRQHSVADNRPHEPTDATFNRARTAALRFLAHRSRSEAEVRRRLESAHTGEVVDRVIAWLRDQRYLDDAAFASEWRRQRELRRPRGQGLIRRELSRLGVSREMVETALEGFDDAENAYLAAQKPAARLKDTGYARFKARLWGHLQRRGFQADVIGKTVQRLWDELTHPLDGRVDADSHAEQSEEHSHAYEAEWRDRPAD